MLLDPERLTPPRRQAVDDGVVTHASPDPRSAPRSAGWSLGSLIRSRTPAILKRGLARVLGTPAAGSDSDEGSPDSHVDSEIDAPRGLVKEVGVPGSVDAAHGAAAASWAMAVASASARGAAAAPPPRRPPPLAAQVAYSTAQPPLAMPRPAPVPTAPLAALTALRDTAALLAARDTGASGTGEASEPRVPVPARTQALEDAEAMDTGALDTAVTGTAPAPAQRITAPLSEQQRTAAATDAKAVAATAAAAAAAATAEHEREHAPEAPFQLLQPKPLRPASAPRRAPKSPGDMLRSLKRLSERPMSQRQTEPRPLSERPLTPPLTPPLTSGRAATPAGFAPPTPAASAGVGAGAGSAVAALRAVFEPQPQTLVEQTLAAFGMSVGDVPPPPTFGLPAYGRSPVAASPIDTGEDTDAMDTGHTDAGRHEAAGLNLDQPAVSQQTLLARFAAAAPNPAATYPASAAPAPTAFAAPALCGQAAAAATPGTARGAATPLPTPPPLASALLPPSRSGAGVGLSLAPTPLSAAAPWLTQGQGARGGLGTQLQARKTPTAVPASSAARLSLARAYGRNAYAPAGWIGSYNAYAQPAGNASLQPPGSGAAALKRPLETAMEAGGADTGAQAERTVEGSVRKVARTEQWAAGSSSGGGNAPAVNAAFAQSNGGGGGVAQSAVRILEHLRALDELAAPLDGSASRTPAQASRTSLPDSSRTLPDSAGRAGLLGRALANSWTLPDSSLAAGARLASPGVRLSGGLPAWRPLLGTGALESPARQAAWEQLFLT
ncbi:hypothetical protein T492DRAFT_522047 [Pavlovales sp. CCMP2436]|nr:hypothetical protein T492DRAFT_522047 [Pavlovales sp. CCMP2436]